MAPAPPSAFTRQLVAVAALCLAAGLVWAGWSAGVASSNAARAAAASITGRLVVSSQPPGAEVSIGGRAYGLTPLAVDLSPGRFSVVVVSPGGGATQSFVTDLRAGESQPHHVTWPERETPRAGR